MAFSGLMQTSAAAQLPATFITIRCLHAVAKAALENPKATLLPKIVGDHLGLLPRGGPYLRPQASLDARDNYRRVVAVDGADWKNAVFIRAIQGEVSFYVISPKGLLVAAARMVDRQMVSLDDSEGAVRAEVAQEMRLWEEHACGDFR